MSAREIIDIDIDMDDEPTQTNRASTSTATASAQASTVATSTAATAAAAAVSAATPAAAAAASAPHHSAGQAPPATAATVADSPAAHMNAHALPAAPLAASSSPSAAAARPSSATAAAPTAAAAFTATTAAAPSTPSAASSLQSAFEHVYREVHKHVPADEGGGAVGSASPLSAAALLDTFSCLMAHHQSLHQQLDASHLAQAHLQARVSASQRELLSFQPFLQSHVVASHAQKHAHLRSAFMDPAIDALLASAHAQRIDLQTKLNEKHERSVADTFSTDSLTGRKLLARTKRLMEENVQFGVLLNDNPAVASAAATISALQLELETQRTINTELNETVTETLDWMNQLESDCEAVVKQAQRQTQEGNTEAAAATAPAPSSSPSEPMHISSSSST